MSNKPVGTDEKVEIKTGTELCEQIRRPFKHLIAQTCVRSVMSDYFRLCTTIIIPTLCWTGVLIIHAGLKDADLGYMAIDNQILTHCVVTTAALALSTNAIILFHT